MSKEVQVYNTQDIKEMAKYLGPLFGKKPEDMFALMLISQAENMHPATAAQEFDIIQGKPAINSRAAQSRFQSSGGKIEFTEYTDAKCTAKFSHPTGTTITVTWTIEDAERIGLASKPTWKQYPRQMLKARVVAEGVRACYPACLSGMYTTDEVNDFMPGRNTPSTETPKAPEFKPQEPRNVSPEPEPEEFDGQIVDEETPDMSFDEQESSGMIPSLEQWSMSLEDNTAAQMIIKWASTQKEDTQAAIVECLNAGEDFGIIEVGIVRAFFMHPALIHREYGNTKIRAIQHFEDNVKNKGLDAINEFLGRAVELVKGHI